MTINDLGNSCAAYAKHLGKFFLPIVTVCIKLAYLANIIGREGSAGVALAVTTVVNLTIATGNMPPTFALHHLSDNTKVYAKHLSKLLISVVASGIELANFTRLVFVKFGAAMMRPLTAVNLIVLFPGYVFQVTGPVVRRIAIDMVNIATLWTRPNKGYCNQRVNGLGFTLTVLAQPDHSIAKVMHPTTQKFGTVHTSYPSKIGNPINTSITQDISPLFFCIQDSSPLDGKLIKKHAYHYSIHAAKWQNASGKEGVTSRNLVEKV